jgi:hypothetical protein
MNNTFCAQTGAMGANDLSKCTCKHYGCQLTITGFKWQKRTAYYRHALADTLDAESVPPESSRPRRAPPAAEPEYDAQELVTALGACLREDIDEPFAVMCTCCAQYVDDVYNMCT